MDPITYLHLQMGLEGKGLVSGNLMRRMKVVPDEELPLMLVARLANEELIKYYDESIEPALQTELSGTDIRFPKVELLLAVLKSHDIQCELGHYKTYMFPYLPVVDDEVVCLSCHDARVKLFGFDGFGNDVFAIICDDALVSACVSTRENETCGETWVYTDPDYRRREFAQKVVKAWAAGLMAAGKVPFYSHKIENEASAGLAKRLGLRPVFEEISITQVQA